MTKSFLKKTIIALPLFASPAWADGGEPIDGPDEAPRTLHLVLRLRVTTLDTPDTLDVTLGRNSSPLPFGNISDSEDPTHENAPERSQTLLALSTPDKESIEITDVHTLPSERDISTAAPLLAEKERLRLQIAALHKQNEALQQELNRREQPPHTPAARSSDKKNKGKHKGVLGQVSRLIGHIENGKF